MTVLDQLAVDRAVLVPPTVCPTFHTFCKTIGKGEPPFDGGGNRRFLQGSRVFERSEDRGGAAPLKTALHESFVEEWPNLG